MSRSTKNNDRIKSINNQMEANTSGIRIERYEQGFDKVAHITKQHTSKINSLSRQLEKIEKRGSGSSDNDEIAKMRKDIDTFQEQLDGINDEIDGILDKLLLFTTATSSSSLDKLLGDGDD